MVRILSLANFYICTTFAYCQQYWKDENEEKEAGNGPLKTLHFDVSTDAAYYIAQAKTFLWRKQKAGDIFSTWNAFFTLLDEPKSCFFVLAKFGDLLSIILSLYLPSLASRQFFMSAKPGLFLSFPQYNDKYCTKDNKFEPVTADGRRKRIHWAFCLFGLTKIYCKDKKVDYI